MSFWSEATEPLRKNRWTMVFGDSNNTGLNLYTYTLKKADRPSYKTTDIQHKFGNYTFNYPGRVEWNTINITFASIPLLDNALLQLFRTAGIELPYEQTPALKGVSKSKFKTAIGKTVLQQLDAEGKVIEDWELINPFFTNVKFGDLSYESEEIVDIECTMRFDTAKFTVSSTNTEL
jgi:hypothetical protein